MAPIDNHHPLEQFFVHGDILLKGQFMLGSNYTFLVDVTHEEQTFPAVYKPSKGEQPLWDFEENTLALREVAAYQVSEALGLGIVPLTVFREEGPHGPGSLQQFIEYDPEYHYFNLTPEDKHLLQPVAFFDLLINNADRKGGHVFFEEGTHKLFAIDHGICFHEYDKLRTVIWDFAGQWIPEELLSKLSSIDNWSNLLGPYLSPEEIRSLESRGKHFLHSRRFPLPPRDRRAFPYPPL